MVIELVGCIFTCLIWVVKMHLPTRAITLILILQANLRVETATNVSVSSIILPQAKLEYTCIHSIRYVEIEHHFEAYLVGVTRYEFFWFRNKGYTVVGAEYILSYDNLGATAVVIVPCKPHINKTIVNTVCS